MPATRVRRSLVVLVTTMVTGAGCTGMPNDERPPETIVRTFLERLDRHDVEGALALLDDDFVFRSADGGFSADREALPAMLAWDQVAAGEIRIEAVEASDDVVEVRLTETNLFTRRLGLRGWLVDARFRVRGGRIAEEVVTEITGDDPPFDRRFARALEPVRRWAEQARPDLADSVFTDGRIARYDASTARRLRELVDAYCRRKGDPESRCPGTDRLPNDPGRP